ncbi:MAG: YlmH/Sll1252 family protein [Bacilli bacterium]
MEKQELLKKYKNKEDRMLASNVLDKYLKYEKTNISTYTNFLDISKEALIINLLKHIKAKYKIYKLDEKSIIYFGDYEDFISIYKIEGHLSHKDILGTLFSIGLDNDTIGDIIVHEDYAYITNLTRLNKVLEQNLITIKNKKIKLEKVDSLEVKEEKFEDLTIIVPSLRLDVVISKLGNFGRNEATKILKDGLVLVNYKEEKTNKNINYNDIISIRKIGKFIIFSEEKRTKKDNIVINVKKYK